MSEMEKIQKYIERTNIPTETIDRYTPKFDELAAMYTAIGCKPYQAMLMLFHYGMAKGMRAARRAKQ